MNLQARDTPGMRRRFVSLAAIVAIILVAIVLIALYGMYSLDRTVVRNQAEIDRVAEMADHARIAQVSFKTEIQEWKNTLLRGHDPDDFADLSRRPFSPGRRMSTGISPRSKRTRQNSDSGRDSSSPCVRPMPSSEAPMTRRWMRFKADDPLSIRTVDASVRGKDRPINDGFDALVTEVKEFADKRRNSLRDEVAGVSDRMRIILYLLSASASSSSCSRPSPRCGRIARPDPGGGLGRGMEIFIDILAGLGLFFVGVKLIASHLKQLSGPWFRRLIERATRSPVAAALLGLLSGALTQSSSAITFISISVVTAGLADVVRVAPMVIWANVGTSVLVLLSAIDISHAVLFLLGVTGIAYYFDVDKAPRLRHLFGALLGLGLLFLGLELIKSGAAPLKEMELVRDFLGFAASSHIAAFIVGAALAVVAQSSAMVSIIAVTMINVGILTLDQTIVIVIGASLGSGIATLLLSANLSGIGRQIGVSAGRGQGARGHRGAADLRPDEPRTAPADQGLPSPSPQTSRRRWPSSISSCRSSRRCSAPCSSASSSRLPRGSHRRPSRSHWRGRVTSMPRRWTIPRTALDLVEKEQARLFARLPGIIDAVRPDGAAEAAPERSGRGEFVRRPAMR